MVGRRLLAEGGVGCYHVVSRVVDRRYVFGAAEKEKFRDLLGRLIGFCGLECVTFCLMSNHFHLLVRVPERAGAVGDSELLRRLRFLYSREEVEEVGRRLEGLRERDPAAADRLVASFTRRMGDLSVFVGELKVRFSRWFNRRNDRKGTLWEERFRSVLVEDSPARAGAPGGSAVLAVAAYIDLNPVRAGLVGDPKDYRWSGYGEAAAGRAGAREPLARAIAGGEADSREEEALAAYRVLLYGTGENARGGGRTGLDPEEVDRIIAEGGRLSLEQLVRCRVRYFTEGAVIGSRSFVEKVFQASRGRFGSKRKTGARSMRAGDWGGLMALRDLGDPVAAVRKGSSPR